MDDQLPNPSKTTLYSGLAVLIGLTILFVCYFVIVLFEMTHQWGSSEGVFEFNKGVFYLPGVVIGLAVLLYVIIRESVLRKKLTEKIASYCTRIAIGAVVIIFAVPYLVEYTVDEHFNKLGYVICETASHQWMHSKIVVYTSNESVCMSLQGMRVKGVGDK